MFSKRSRCFCIVVLTCLWINSILSVLVVEDLCSIVYVCFVHTRFCFHSSVFLLVSSIPPVLNNSVLRHLNFVSCWIFLWIVLRFNRYFWNRHAFKICRWYYEVHTFRSIRHPWHSTKYYISLPPCYKPVLSYLFYWFLFGELVLNCGFYCIPKIYIFNCFLS